MSPERPPPPAPPLVPYAEMVVMKAESEAAKEKETDENTQRDANTRKNKKIPKTVSLRFTVGPPPLEASSP